MGAWANGTELELFLGCQRLGQGVVVQHAPATGMVSIRLGRSAETVIFEETSQGWNPVWPEELRGSLHNPVRFELAPPTDRRQEVTL